MSLRTWLQEPVTEQGRTRAWRIWFWGVQLPMAGLLGAIGGVVLGAVLGCTTPGERQPWQDCSGTFHESCWEGDDWSLSQMCEYAYYKDCIGEKD